MSEVAILVPVLRRPQNVRPLVDSIRSSTPEPHRIVFIADPGDQAELDAIAAVGGCDVIVEAGNYAHKINVAARAAPEPLLFLGADDLRFHPGWLPAARALLTDEILVVGTNDLGNARVMAGEHATHCLIDARYVVTGTIDEPGVLLHEGYPHEYVDDELVQTAIRRGAFRSARDSVVEHLHPNWGKAPTDALYDAQRARMRAGYQIFYRRRRLWTT